MDVFDTLVRLGLHRLCGYDKEISDGHNTAFGKIKHLEYMQTKTDP